MLDLFSGTGSVANVYKDRGFEVTTLDLDPKTQPDILANILEWDYAGTFQPGHFHTIFAAPHAPNTQWRRPRDPRGSWSWPTPSS